MRKFLVLLFCAVVFARSALGLQCYNCAGHKDCEQFEDKSKISIATCGNPAISNHKVACLKKIIEDKHTKTVNITRQCVTLADGKSEMECKAPSDRYSVLHCSTCFDDLCNTAAGIYLSIFSTVGLVFSYLITKTIIC